MSPLKNGVLNPKAQGNPNALRFLVIVAPQPFLLYPWRAEDPIGRVITGFVFTSPFKQ